MTASNAANPIDALVQAFEAITKVYGFEAEDFEQMWSTVKSCLTFPGDHGAFPSRAFLDGDRARKMLLALEQELRELSKGCTGIASVGADHEDSECSVFWDFTYVISMPSGSYVFVGASSD